MSFSKISPSVLQSLRFSVSAVFVVLACLINNESHARRPIKAPKPEPVTATAPAPEPITAPTPEPAPEPVPVPAGSCQANENNEYRVGNYYVDALAGNDNNTGASTSPWKTLARSMSAAAPATVIVRNGNYGLLQELSPRSRSGFLTIRAEKGHYPVITGVKLTYPSEAAARLRLIGFTVKPDNRDGGSVVAASRVTDLEIWNNTIVTEKYAAATAVAGAPKTFDGVSLTDTKRVQVLSNCITSVFRGIQASTSSDVVIKGNYITPQSGSGIQYLAGNSRFLIEDNHIQGQAYVPYPLDPDAVKDPHSSIISIRSGSLVIRNNIMHNMGTSSGMMFYLPDVVSPLAVYSDVTIEGNLIYDVHNDQVLRLYNVGARVLVRNNLVISRYRLTPGVCDGITQDARYRYNTALTVPSYAAGHNGSGLTMANNVFIGIVALPSDAVDINNVAWSYSIGGVFVYPTQASTSSKIIASAYLGCGRHPLYFESGFFSTTIRYDPNHGMLLQPKIATSSDAYAFGNREMRLDRLLGALDAKGLFMIPAGNRAEGNNSVGPY